MNFLFIGGPADGRQISLPHVDSDYRIPTYNGKAELYRPYRLAADENTRYVVYVHDSLTPADAMYRLITGYNGFEERANTVASRL